jgi:hypothetical protein
MIIDAQLLANMIATGIQAASEHVEEIAEVTLNEAAAIVYVTLRDRRLYRVRVESLFPLQSHHEEGRDGG